MLLSFKNAKNPNTSNSKQLKDLEDENSRLKKALSEEKNAKSELLDQIGNLLGSLGINRDTLVELGIASEDISKSAESQNVSVLNCVSTFEGMSKKINITQESIECAKENISALSEISDEANVSFNKMVDSSAKVSDNFNIVLDSINSVTGKFSGIDTFIKSITDIASKLNILSFNASIEAARAGESGKGFSVVAQEVRALAGVTKESSKDILSALENIRQELSGIINISKLSVSALEDQTLASNTATEAFLSVKFYVEEVVDSINEVHKASAETQELKDKSSKEIYSIAQNSEHILSTVQEITSSVEEQSASVDKSVSMVELLNESLRGGDFT